LTPRDPVIAIAFPRYLTDTVVLARHVADRGLPLITLTDGPTSPLAPLSETVLYVRANRQRAANSDTAVLSMLQALYDAVAYRSRDSVRAASMTAESVLPWLYENRPSETPARSSASPKARKPAIKRRPSPKSKQDN
jgi:DNA-binding MurR/RpiR family transcriptional regulator